MGLICADSDALVTCRHIWSPIERERAPRALAAAILDLRHPAFLSAHILAKGRRYIKQGAQVVVSLAIGKVPEEATLVDAHKDINL